MPVHRTATAVWEGDLTSGAGQVSAETSGTFQGLPVTWASRISEPQGKTSPEELIAAAHGSCFSMSLSGTLAKKGTPATRLEVEATSSFEKLEEGWRMTSIQIMVRGKVEGIDAATFQEAVKTAAKECPVSNALKGNVAIDSEGVLE